MELTWCIFADIILQCGVKINVNLSINNTNLWIKYKMQVKCRYNEKIIKIK